MRGRNTAPILAQRHSEYRSVRSGNISAIRRYHGGRYRVFAHRRYNTFNNCTYASGRYNSPNDYHSRVNPRLIYNSTWIMEPVSFTFNSGYHCIDNYPYYVHNGYRYRYSPIDLCNYELVDLDARETEYDETKHKVIKTYYQVACNLALDQCAAKRDQLNKDQSSQRYICMEKIDDSLKPSDNFDNIPAMVNNLTPAQVNEIKAYLSSIRPRTLFKTGRKRGVNGCKIVKSRKCNYAVEVDGVSYPMKDGSICSSNRKSDLHLYGCQANSQKTNAACILALAIAEGYCL